MDQALTMYSALRMNLLMAARFELPHGSPHDKSQWFETMLSLNRDEQVLLMIGIVTFSRWIGRLTVSTEKPLHEQLYVFNGTVPWTICSSPAFYPNLISLIQQGFEVMTKLLEVEREKYLDHFADAETAT
jgi:hypothetical protein